MTISSVKKERPLRTKKQQKIGTDNRAIKNISISYQSPGERGGERNSEKADRTREEREKGKKVKVEYMKLFIGNNIYRWNEKKKVLEEGKRNE